MMWLCVTLTLAWSGLLAAPDADFDDEDAEYPDSSSNDVDFYDTPSEDEDGMMGQNRMRRFEVSPPATEDDDLVREILQQLLTKRKDILLSYGLVTRSPSLKGATKSNSANDALSEIKSPVHSGDNSKYDDIKDTGNDDNIGNMSANKLKKPGDAFSDNKKKSIEDSKKFDFKSRQFSDDHRKSIDELGQFSNDLRQFIKKPSDEIRKFSDEPKQFNKDLEEFIDKLREIRGESSKSVKESRLSNDLTIYTTSASHHTDDKTTKAERKKKYSPEMNTDWSEMFLKMNPPKRHDGIRRIELATETDSIYQKPTLGLPKEYLREDQDDKTTDDNTTPTPTTTKNSITDGTTGGGDDTTLKPMNDITTTTGGGDDTTLKPMNDITTTTGDGDTTPKPTNTITSSTTTGGGDSATKPTDDSSRTTMSDNTDKRDSATKPTDDSSRTTMSDNTDKSDSDKNNEKQTGPSISTNSMESTSTKAWEFKLDINALVDIIRNLTGDYDTNLTEVFNMTLQKYQIPTCATPAPVTTTPVPTTTTTTTPSTTTTTTGYDYEINATGTIMGKCFVCGLEDAEIPRNAYCADAFAGDFIPLVPVDYTARGHLAVFRKYCRFMNIPKYHINQSDPRSIWGRWTGGCSVRWIDLSGVYTQRACRNRNRALMGKHFLSKRMAKLEMALQNVENGCIISPMASLVPLSRGISLFARFHACVCTGSWCNIVSRLQPARWSLIAILVQVGSRL